MKSNIWKCYLIKFIRQSHIFGAITVPFFLEWGGLTYTKMFILQSWFMFWIFALEIPTGFVADKYGRKISIAIGALFLALGSATFGLFNSYPFFFVGEFFFALGLALISGADNALFYDSLQEAGLEKDSRKYMTRFEAAGTIGIVAGLPIGSMIAGSNILPYPKTLPLTFLITAGVEVIHFLVALTLKEPKRQKIKENFLRAGLDGVKHVLTHAKLRAYSLNFILVNAATFFIFWFYQPLAGRAGINIKYFGFIAAAFNIFGMLLLLSVKRIEQHFKLRNILIFTAIVPGFIYIGLGLFKHVIFVLAGIILLGGLKIFRRPILVDFMNKHIESQNRATVLSGVSMLERLLMLVLYPLVGWLSDRSLNATLMTLGVITLVFAFFARLKAETIAEGD